MNDLNQDFQSEKQEEWTVLFDDYKKQLTHQQIHNLIISGKIKRNQKVWKKGIADWVTISTVEEFQSSFLEVPPETPVDYNIKNKLSHLSKVPKFSFKSANLVTFYVFLFLFLIGLGTNIAGIALSFYVIYCIFTYTLQYRAWSFISDTKPINIIICSIVADILCPIFWIIMGIHNELRKNNENAMVLFVVALFLFAVLVFLYKIIWWNFKNKYEKRIDEMCVKNAPELGSAMYARTWAWIIPFFQIWVVLQSWHDLCKVLDYFDFQEQDI